jgi:hypothetical protein
MGVFTSAGTRRTKTTVAKSTPTVDPELKIDEDLYVTRSYGTNDPVPEGSLKELLVKAGTIVRTSVHDSWFPPATATSISPATGLAAGSTTVTITGTNLDGVTGITFDGAAATSVVVVSSTKVTCHTPAGSTGPADVVLTDDSGALTKLAFYTYT